MQRYLLFVGDEFYPLGGMLDFRYDSDSIQGCKSYYLNFEFYQWAHIWDSHQRKIILKCENLRDDFSEVNYQWSEVK